MKHSQIAIVCAGALLAGCQQHPTPAVTPASSRSVAATGADSDRAGGPAATPRPYATVITHAAKTRVGMFKTHRVGGKLYFEIPPKELGVDMLIVGRFARAPVATDSGSSRSTAYGGDEFGTRTIRWERSGDRVILRSPSFAIMADTALPIYQAVTAGSYAPIIAVFDVAAYGPDSAVVIDVTRLYTTDVPEFAAIHGKIDEKRSFIESAVSFPDNVEVEATQTGIPTPVSSVQPGPDNSTGRDPRVAESVLAHWSMVRLPERPMQPRLVDDRVGFFGLTRIDFGTKQYHAVQQRYIARWRLEKKFPDSALSEPVKPLVYYVDPATPDVWKPWIRKAITDWEPAFEAAGFKNAIIAADPPAADPDWSPDDVRHTVIRWLPSTVENARGPHISDPRTGEILNGSIRMYHNILNLLRDWYFVQVSPLDPRAQHLPMPDSLIGRLLEFATAHEIGHTLGLYHNFKASSEYPADSVRSATWVHRMGYSPSIMDYSRFDYVAQPEDHIALADMVSHVGPYDKFAIMWGYTPIPSARTAEDERSTLDGWARMQDTIPWLRFGHLAETMLGARNPDPGDETEAVGDADAVKSTGYGVKNIKRIIPMLLDATQRPGEDNSKLDELYGRVVKQWTTEMLHDTHIVGGADVQIKYGSQPGPIYTPVSRARQSAAVQFLNDNAFATPTFLVNESITSRLEPSGSLDRIAKAQQQILTELLADARTARVVEYAMVAPGDAYVIGDLLDDLSSGIWSELRQPRVSIDVFRRNLQQAYLDQLNEKINPPLKPAAPTLPSLPSSPSGTPAQGTVPDVRTAMRGELIDLRSQIKAAIPRAVNRETRRHLVDARDRIDNILDPNK